MAKKKQEEGLQYLQMPLPEGRKYSKMTKVAFGGLNKRYTIDSGNLTMEQNISTSEYPYITPSPLRRTVKYGYSKPISMFGFDDFLVVVYWDSTDKAINIDYIDSNGDVYTGVLKENVERGSEDIDTPRSIVQFNVYEQSEDIVNGAYNKRLLIFPDKMSMPFYVDGDFTPDPMPDSMTPNIKYATVYLSRVFGVSDDSVYASGFNDYTNWNLDTIDEYNENNAWMSKTQSNTKADGNFTGITNFQGHIVCFKRDYMHEIYNTKNPFRIQDIYAEGTIDNRSIQDVDGKLIFVSDDNVKIYTGSNPRIIGHNLNMSRYVSAVSGTDNRNYYLCCVDAEGKKYLYVYDTYTELWSEQNIESKVVDFAHNKNGMYMLCDTYDVSGSQYKGGVIYKLDTDNYEQFWSFETDLITNKTVDIKHIKKLQMLVELECGVPIWVYILYDDEVWDKLPDTDKEKRLVYTNTDITGVGKTGRFPIRVKPRNTANYGFKLHVEGNGYAKIYELEIFVEQGGDLYV